MTKARILIIEDEKLIRWSLRQHIQEQGYQVDEAESGHQGLEKFAKHTFDLILLDHRLPDMTGLQVLEAIRQQDSDVVVILITAYSNVEDAVKAMRLGAHDYISKPFNMDALMVTVEKALETTLLKRQVRDFRSQIQSRFGMHRIIGQCQPMQELFELIRNVADRGSSTIFLRGESGTGKDLVAKAIHYNSDRADRPFMTITCTALAENLLESELFGHEKGAFTDAKTQKKGLLQMANGGTVFLDEVGDMPTSLQAKLLRFLEEKVFRRVGGVHDIEVDVRIITATNRDIDRLVRESKFREDLYYRLNIIPIVLPPLRERGDDVELLAKHFIAEFAAEFRRPINGIKPAAMARLRAYPWPGNVRELRNLTERAVLLSKHDQLDVEDFVLGRGEEKPWAEGFRLPPGGVRLADVEEQLVRQALRQTNNNQTHAAELLGISRDQLRYRMEKYGLL